LGSSLAPLRGLSGGASVPTADAVGCILVRRFAAGFGAELCSGGQASRPSLRVLCWRSLLPITHFFEYRKRWVSHGSEFLVSGFWFLVSSERK